MQVTKLSGIFSVSSRTMVSMYWLKPLLLGSSKRESLTLKGRVVQLSKLCPHCTETRVWGAGPPETPPG